MKAITYGWRNLENGKMYLGFHKTKDVHDGYITSSEDAELRNAWSLGKMERHILWTGSVAECITLENFGLKYAKSELDWDQFYNKSVGGGVGLDKTHSILTEEMKQSMIDFMNGVDPVPAERDVYETFDYALIEKISQGVKDGLYEKVAADTKEIFDLPRNQVRMSIIHEDKVVQISDRMIEDPKSARENVEPIIICVYPDGKKEIIDGNHTTNAAKRAGWSEVDVVFINFSDFDFNKSNVDAFGYQMNHSEKIKTPNSKQDCQQAIIKIYQELTAKGVEVDVDGEKFRDTVLAQLSAGRWWTKQMISANLKSARTRIKTDIINAGRNFRKWTKPELDRLAREYESADDKLAVISITSGSVYNAGLGGILNKMGGMSTDKGLIIVHHNNIDEYDHWKASEKKFKAASKFVDADIEYVVLDCFA